MFSMTREEYLKWGKWILLANIVFLFISIITFQLIWIAINGLFLYWNINNAKKAGALEIWKEEIGAKKGAKIFNKEEKENYRVVELK